MLAARELNGPERTYQIKKPSIAGSYDGCAKDTIAAVLWVLLPLQNILYGKEWEQT